MKEAVRVEKFSYVYLSLFVCIGPEKPQWGVANYVHTHATHKFANKE